MKKRLIAMALMVAMLVGVVAMSGCSIKGGKNADAAVTAYVIPEGGFDVNSEVTITFTHTMGAKLQEVLNTYIAEFNKIYPNITI